MSLRALGYLNTAATSADRAYMLVQQGKTYMALDLIEDAMVELTLARGLLLPAEE